MKDKELIIKLGGVQVISDKLGLNYTTVHNWLTRGIPSKVKVEYPEIFMPSSLDDVKPLTQNA